MEIIIIMIMTMMLIIIIIILSWLPCQDLQVLYRFLPRIIQLEENMRLIKIGFLSFHSCAAHSHFFRGNTETQYGLNQPIFNAMLLFLLKEIYLSYQNGDKF